jgi:hypothetical protein
MKITVHFVSGKSLSFEDDGKIIKALKRQPDTKYIWLTNGAINLDQVEVIEFTEE